MSLEITFQQGGTREFQRTGIYPEYLLFNLVGNIQHWRVKLKNKSQNGVLKSQGIVVYEYSFDKQWCRYRKVNDDGSYSKWMEPEIMNTEMRD